eukprot:CAMPEP_0203902392 /NCGR_PEP_ID=MMETSP0359-20131031/44458_1 /ASSEMBLY_ACC=CAM_ASM_000338 /TAXON_ID=268821 /ORGANISM="Scrippsiella Hangoei, Strain SHTV-5" /LENGTH=89 /DNA_ID=CAMNT_0050826229 /DNA_START=52 /DNA_END=321 /DNA_ORIENTATION=-
MGHYRPDHTVSGSQESHCTNNRRQSPWRVADESHLPGMRNISTPLAVHPRTLEILQAHNIAESHHPSANTVCRSAEKEQILGGPQEARM